MSKLEHTVQHAVLREFGRMRNGRLWRINVGKAKTEDGRMVSFGVVGHPDVTGVIRVQPVCENCFHVQPERGLWFGLETKREEGGVTSPTQHSFHAMIRQYGGLIAVVNSIEEAREYMRKWGAEW